MNKTANPVLPAPVVYIYLSTPSDLHVDSSAPIDPLAVVVSDVKPSVLSGERLSRLTHALEDAASKAEPLKISVVNGKIVAPGLAELSDSLAATLKAHGVPCRVVEPSLPAALRAKTFTVAKCVLVTDKITELPMRAGADKLAEVLRRISSASKKGKRYTLRKDDGKYSCSCPDFKYRHAAQGTHCKHITAHLAKTEKKAETHMGFADAYNAGLSVAFSKLAGFQFDPQEFAMWQLGHGRGVVPSLKDHVFKRVDALQRSAPGRPISHQAVSDIAHNVFTQMEGTPAPAPSPPPMSRVEERLQAAAQRPAAAAAPPSLKVPPSPTPAAPAVPLGAKLRSGLTKMFRR